MLYKHGKGHLMRCSFSKISTTQTPQSYRCSKQPPVSSVQRSMRRRNDSRIRGNLFTVISSHVSVRLLAEENLTSDSRHQNMTDIKNKEIVVEASFFNYKRLKIAHILPKRRQNAWHRRTRVKLGESSSSGGHSHCRAGPLPHECV